MATPRYKLVDGEEPCSYHLVSRCVRRAWLCGWDDYTERDYSYRREWLIERLETLGRCFAVEVFNFAVMSNHFHVVVHYDPKACESWSDEEVARRWVEVFPPTEHGRIIEERKAEARELLLDDANRLERARRSLGSLSEFMKHLKQPIARRANAEDDCTGHFFEQRFYSGALLSDEAVLAAMVYVDLNPVRADLECRLEECRDSSASRRLRENSAEALEDYLRPLASGLEDSWGNERQEEPTEPPQQDEGLQQDEFEEPRMEEAPREHATGALSSKRRRGWVGGGPGAQRRRRRFVTRIGARPWGARGEEEDNPPKIAGEPARRKVQGTPTPRVDVRLKDYIALLENIVETERNAVEVPDELERWRARVSSIHRRQRAYGSATHLEQWAKKRNMRLREVALPD